MTEKNASVHWQGAGKDAYFQEIAGSAKRDCPLSKALASVAEITLTAALQTP